MLKFAEISLLSLGMVIGMCNPAEGASAVSGSIKPEKLTIGDKFQFINKVPIAPGTKIAFEPLPGSLGEAHVISDIRKLRSSSADTAVYACSLAIYKTGDFMIPTFSFTAVDTLGNRTEISGDSVAVTVLSVLPPDSAATAQLKMADIREPYRLPGPKWPYIVFPLIAIAVIAGAYLAYKYSAKRQFVPVVPPRPAWNVAFEKLDILKRERHYDFGRIKVYYFELSLIIREYLEGRFEFPAVERTTFELEDDDRVKAVGERYYKRLFEFFQRADMAKFAKGAPLRLDADADLSFIYEFVKETIPRISVDEKEKSDSPEDKVQDVQV